MKPTFLTIKLPSEEEAKSYKVDTKGVIAIKINKISVKIAVVNEETGSKSLIIHPWSVVETIICE